MELGIHLTRFALPGGAEAIAPAVAGAARAAEDGGCAVVTVMDHFFQLEAISRAEDPMLEGYTALGFLAGQTERITLSLLVGGVTYRHPGLLAKTVTTLDVLSGGRSMFGIGAAWYEREHTGLGVPFPPIARRFEQLEETLQICRQMWSADDGPYEGRHFQLAETLCSPQPIQRPGPPILIGGGGERKTLRLVARYADACNLIARDRGVVEHKLGVLDRHCETEGRDPSEVRRTILAVGDPLADPDGFVREMAAYAELGVDLAWVSPPAVDDPADWVSRVATHAVPRLAQLGG